MKTIEKVYIRALLLCCVLMAFVWGATTLYYVVFLAGLGGAWHIAAGRKIKRWQFAWVLLLFVANIFSAMSGQLLGEIPFNWSWIIQMLLFPLILLGIDDLKNKWPTYFDRQLKLMLFLSLFILIMQQYTGIVEMGLTHLQSLKSLFVSDSYTYANVAREKFGLMKSVISFVATVLFLSIRHKFTIRQQVLMFIFILFSTLTVGAKANLVGVLALVLIFFISRLSMTWHKVVGLIFIVFVVAIPIIVFFDELYMLSIYDGRYLLPVLMSHDFWSLPFGVGMGNYVYAASTNLISVTTLGAFSIKIPETMHDAYSLYPVAESDILLLSVSFGWIFYAIYIGYILRIIYRYVFTNACHNLYFGRGAELMIYLFFAGFFQDFFNVHTYWVFWAISVSLIHAAPTLNKRDKKGRLSLKLTR